MARVALRRPELPYISNVSGRYAGDEATDPSYWGRQLREPVRFADGLSCVAADLDPVWLEVGPGNASSTFALRSLDTPTVVQSWGRASDAASDDGVLLEAAGRLWLAGVDVEAARLEPSGGGRRCRLPTHPFEPQRCWIDAPAPGRMAALVPDVDKAPTGPISPAAPEADYPTRQVLGVPYVAPTTDDERRIIAIWEEVLGIRGIGMDDDFFELGGHSLLATTLVGRLREQFERDLALQSLFEKPTVRQTARLLCGAPTDLVVSIDERHKSEILELLAELTEEESEPGLDAALASSGSGRGTR
jgi:acyl carrier protein